MSDSIPKLSDYHVSEECGFMLEDPLETLPEYFEPWEKVGKNCVKLLLTKQLRHEVDKMELLDVKRLKGYRQHRLAYMFLSFATNGYVWQDGDSGVPKVLPKQLAVPMCYLSDYIGTKPAMGNAAFCLSNWKIIDKSLPPQLGNLETICQYPGGEGFDWFVLVTAAIEFAAVPGIKAMVSLLHALHENNEDNVIDNLTVMTETLVSMKQILSRMHEKLTASGFYNTFRPFLAGWGGADSPLPEGLIYEGVWDEPHKVIGGSAAQNSPIGCFDAVLGIKHQEDKLEFLNTMLKYMPRDHREFILQLRKVSSLRSYVNDCTNKSIINQYEECVSALRAFRSYHINLVTKYVLVPSKNENNRSNKNYRSVAQTGTGGTALIPFLQGLRNTTAP